MKKLLFSFGCAIILTINIQAESLLALTYGQYNGDKKLNNTSVNLKLDKISFLKLKSAITYFPERYDSEKIGAPKNFIEAAPIYFDIGYGIDPTNKFILDGEQREFDYYSILLNIGRTYTLNNHIVLFTGIGGEYRRFDHRKININKQYNFNTDEQQNQEWNFNLNGGVAFYYNRWGLIVDYDSSLKSYNAGLTFRF